MNAYLELILENQLEIMRALMTLAEDNEAELLDHRINVTDAFFDGLRGGRVETSRADCENTDRKSVV